APTIPGDAGPIHPTVCRMSPALERVAFWGPDVRGLFLANAQEVDRPQLLARFEGEHLSDLAWSRDGQYLGFIVSGGPPPGELSVGVLRLSDRKSSRLAGQAFAW